MIYKQLYDLKYTTYSTQRFTRTFCRLPDGKQLNIAKDQISLIEIDVTRLTQFSQERLPSQAILTGIAEQS